MKKILLVDDEQDVRESLANILQRRDYEVATASNGTEAINLVKQLLPDLIILDVLLPDIDGTAVASTLEKCESTKNIPIIFLTGILTKGEELPDKRTGKHCAVAKPVSTEELMTTISKALA